MLWQLAIVVGIIGAVFGFAIGELIIEITCGTKATKRQVQKAVGIGIAIGVVFAELLLGSFT